MTLSSTAIDPLESGFSVAAPIRLFFTIENGKVIEGARWADAIRKLIVSADCRIRPEVRGSLELEASFAAENSAPHPKQRTKPGKHPLYGCGSLEPPFRAMVPHPDEPESMGWLRLALLYSHVPALGNGLSSLIKAYTPEIVQYILREPAPSHAKFQAALSVYEAAFRTDPLTRPRRAGWSPTSGPSPLEVAWTWHQAAGNALETPSTSPERQKKPPPFSQPPPRKPYFITKPTRLKKDRVVDEGEDDELLSGDPWPEVHGDEVDQPVPATARLAADLVQNQRTRAYELWLCEKQADLHLAGPLFAGTDRSFIRQESTITLSKLEILVAHHPDLARSGAALAMVLSALSSRSRQEAAHALVSFLNGDAPFGACPVQIVDGFLRNRADFSFGISPDSIRPPWRPTVQHFDIPLSDAIRKELSFHAAQSGHPLLDWDEEQWEAEFKAIRAILAAPTNEHPAIERFSEEKLRHIAPVALWSKKADIRIVQTCLGQLFDHQKTQLHYCVFEPEFLNQAYCEAIGRWVPPAFAPTPSKVLSTTPIGSPNGAVEPLHAINAIARFKVRVEASFKHSSHSVERAMSAYNHLLLWTCAFMAAATSHRLTWKWLPTITLSDFIFDFAKAGSGIFCFWDKETDNAFSFRANPVISDLQDQIRALLGALVHLQTALNKLEKGNSLLDREIDKALTGQASLFRLAVLDRGKVVLRDLGEADFQKYWPEWGLDIDALRKLFVDLCLRYDINADSTFRLNGHTCMYEPGSAEDPASPISLINEVTDKIQIGTRECGWEALGVRRQLDQTSADLHLPTGPQILASHKALLGQFRAKYKSYLDDIASVRFQGPDKKEAAQKREFIEQAVTVALTKLVPDYDPNTPTKGHHLPDAMAMEAKAILLARFETQDECISAVRRLRVRLHDHITKAQWTSVLPGVPARRRVRLPTITRECVWAFHWLRRLLHHAETTLLSDQDSKLIKGDSPSGRLLAATCIELAARSGIVTIERMMGVLRALPFALSAGSPDGVTLDIPFFKLEPGDLDSKQLHTILDGYLASEERDSVKIYGLPAVMSLSWTSRELNGSGITIEMLEAALLEHLPAEFLGKVEAKEFPTLNALLKTMALARRLFVSGSRAAWEDGRLSSRNLPVAREQALRTNAPPCLNSIIQSAQLKSRSAAGLGSPSCIRLRLNNLRNKLGTHADHRNSASVAAQDIEETFLDDPELTGTEIALARFTCSRLRALSRQGKKAVSTVYGNLTTIMSSSLDVLVDRDLLTLDGTTLAQLVVQVTYSKPADHQERTLSTLLWLCDEVEKLTGVVVDEDTLSECDIPTPRQAAPYLVTRAEMEWVTGQIEHWAKLAVNDANAPFHSLEFWAAARMGDIYYACGPRKGELPARLTTDLMNLNEDRRLRIVGKKGSPLKTITSPRLLPLSEQLTSPQLDALDKLINYVNDLQRNKSDQKLIFDLTHALPHAPSVNRLITILTAAMDLIVDNKTSRVYSGRHAHACSGVTAIHLRTHEDCLPEFEGLSPVRALPFPKAWSKAGNIPDESPPSARVDSAEITLPAALSLREFARRLGQGSAKTTLTHYTHVLGWMRFERGLPEPTVAALARAGLTSYGALRARLMDRKNLRNVNDLQKVQQAVGLKAPDHAKSESALAPEYSDTFPTLATATTSTSISLPLMGEIVTDLLNDMDKRRISLFRDVDMSVIDRIQHAIDRTTEHFSPALKYSKKSSAAKRVPRVDSWKAGFGAADGLRTSNPDRWHLFLRELEQQDVFDGSIICHSSAGEAVVTDLLKSLCINGEQVSVPEKEEPRCLSIESANKIAIGSGVQRSKVIFLCLISMVHTRFEGWAETGIQTPSLPPPTQPTLSAGP